MPPVTCSTPAVVLSSSAMGESDLLVSLFTLDAGKIRAVAKGAKRSRKRFMNALEPFTEIDAGLVKNRSSGLWRLDSAAIVSSHEPIRKDYESFVYGCLCLELVNLWQKEGIRDRGVYALLRWFLSALSGQGQPVCISLVFKARLLEHSGFMPGLKACRECGKTPGRGPVFFDRLTGEILCQECADSSVSVGKIGLGTVRSLDFMVSSSLERIGRLKPGRDQIREGWEYMKQLHCRHLQRQPSCYKLIQEKSNGRKT